MPVYPSQQKQGNEFPSGGSSGFDPGKSKYLFTHDVTGLAPDEFNSEQFRRSQAGRWLVSGDPKLEGAAARDGNVLVFPDGSRVRYKAAHRIHTTNDFQRPSTGGSRFDEWYRTLSKGENFDYNGPVVFGDFLSEETAPGGFLAPANQSVQAAQGTRSLFEQSRQRRGQAQSALGASGLSSRYATAILGQGEEEDIGMAREQLSQAGYASEQRRFESTLAWLNQAAQSVTASQQDKRNRDLAESEAERRRKSNMMGTILGGTGAVIGGIYGGPTGAQLGYGFGSQFGSSFY